MKYENEKQIVNNGNEKSIQYEVYAPNSNIKLDLSVCSDVKIDIYVPIQLNEEIQKLYDDLKSQGYNLFDKNDKFYTDICTPYKSKNGTDILLSDRLNDIFSPNQLSCQANCEFSEYSQELQYLKCECDVIKEEKIETEEPEKITAKSVAKSVYDILKYSNYKVLKCYKLVFRKVTFIKNIGSILSLFYFLGYLIALIIFCVRKLSYLKHEVSKLFKKEKVDKEKEKADKEKEKGIDLNKEGPIIYNKNKETKKDDIKDIKNSKKKEDKKNIIKNAKKRKSDVQIKDNDKYKDNSIKEKDKKDKKRTKSINISDKNKFKESILENKNIASKKYLNIKLPNSIERINKKEKEIEIKEILDTKKGENEKEILSDYELSDLEYILAKELDKRNFFKIYWYLLKREHLILFTFFNWNDFNIFSIKLSKLFLAI